MDYNELISCFQDTIKMSEDELQDATLEAIDNTCVLKENIYEEVFENSNVKIKERPEDADVFVEVNTTFATAKEYLQDGKVAVLNLQIRYVPVEEYKTVQSLKRNVCAGAVICIVA